MMKNRLLWKFPAATLILSCIMAVSCTEDIVVKNYDESAYSNLDCLTGYLTEVLNGTEDKAAALAVLDGERGNIAKIAQDELYRNGFDYKVRVELKREVFPERVYDGYVFPEGEYDALIVSLGEGVGDNWWCVAFPPLCFVPADGDEKIVYKSWVKEMLEKIFG